MPDPHDPHEVLAAVRRLEAELDELRARTRRSAAPDLEGLRQAIAADSARERRAVVEDLDTMLDLIGESWRDTRGQIGRLEARVGELGDQVQTLVDAMRTATFEVRFGAPTTNGNGNGVGPTHHGNGAGLNAPAR
jgi:hypothetical protein